MPGESIYGTFLREPREKVISNYYYMKTTKHHPNYNLIKSGELSFLKHINNLNNPMCYRLDKMDLTNINSWSKRPASEVYLRALAVLDEMAFIGIPSEFDKSLQIIAKVCAWDHVPERITDNVTKERPQWDDLSSKEQDLIDENTKYDRKLYDAGVSIFNKQYNELFSKNAV